MRYFSTRGGTDAATASEAVVSGIAGGGGLFAPETIPLAVDSSGSLNGLIASDYRELAVKIMRPYLSGFTGAELAECAAAYSYGDGFDDPDIAPLVRAGGSDCFFLELFHGKTLAFKDMALSMLPALMRIAAGKTGRENKILILAATSGDTGKAALEYFADKAGFEIAVFFPEDGVSAIQKKQMTTQRGGNTFAAGIKGNFDDAQNGVKQMFVNERLRNDLLSAGYELTSANSINVGRLLPQIVYYFYAYSQMVNKFGLRAGDKINFTVPTGNFGNILAAYYAKKMGLPVNRLVCASNVNNVLCEFFNTGVYDRNREFYRTASPSMDILISSNLERFLYHLAGSRVAGLMAALKESGSFRYGGLTDEIAGYYATEEETMSGIKQMWDEGYLIDTHTSVAYGCYKKYTAETRDASPNVVVATASPYKFAKDVCFAISGEETEADAFAAMDELSRLTGTPVPKALNGLAGMEERHATVCGTDEMEDILRRRYL